MEFFDVNVDTEFVAGEDCTTRTMIFLSHKCGNICGGRDVVAPSPNQFTKANTLQQVKTLQVRPAVNYKLKR